MLVFIFVHLLLSYFTAYESLRAEAEKRVGWEYAPLVAGAPARTLSAFVTSPLELLRTYMQSKQKTACTRE